MPAHPATPHTDHDRLLVVEYAAGDAAGTELDRAIEQVASCPDCAALHHDLRAIAAALPGLPPPVRTRDFRLTAEQAASLRPSGLRRLLAPFAGPRFAFAAPLGTGLATLGVAGLLLAGTLGTPLTSNLGGGGAAAPLAAATEAPAVAPGEAAGQELTPVPAPSPAASEATRPLFGSSPSADGPDAAGVEGQPSMAPAASAELGERASEPTLAAAAPGETDPALSAPGGTDPGVGSTTSWLPVARLGALLALAAGLVMMALRLTARRFA